MPFAVTAVTVSLLAFSAAQELNATTNFQLCLQNVTNPTSPWYNSSGGRDINGGNLTSMAGASAISYSLCIEACGAGPEPFNWPDFSQQFSAWLLPWLALISQLPFGAKLRSENMMSVLLTVGSPTLAAFSVALTVLNERWIARRFSSYHFHNRDKAVKILTNLQQTHLEVTSKDGLLASLVVLPDNDKWWEKLAKSLDYEQTWSVATATSIAWVVIAYIFTVIDSFFAILDNINSNGQAVGSVWLWLLPIVVGWLQISPKCDLGRIKEAMVEANQIAYIAVTSPSSPTQSTMVGHSSAEASQTADDHHSHSHHVSSSSSHTSTLPPAELLAGRSERAFSIRDAFPGIEMHDAECSAPIYNYTRFFSWVTAVNEVLTAFHYASEKARSNMPVHCGVWSDRPQEDRKGDFEQVEAYCRPSRGISYPFPSLRLNLWGADTFSRLFIAIVMALLLQWGTTGAAVIVVWFTPTKGLGCRSLAYILYAGTSTVVCVMMVLSSVLAHYANKPAKPQNRRSNTGSEEKGSLLTGSESDNDTIQQHNVRRDGIRTIAHLLSTILRRSGKSLAALNAIGIIAACIFQFSNFFDRCFCNSSVFWLGTQRGYSVIAFTDPSIMPALKNAWLGAIVLALTSAFGFIAFINTFLDAAIRT
ncbi:hypothetical protein HWV62_21898 [Athelia sp. TMB]|nr:hypothetical protein HWV62_21898 [Athelia sp. TMB]